MENNKNVKNFKQFNESLIISNDIFNQIESQINVRMDELVGQGDYTVSRHGENKIVVSFRSGNISDSEDMGNDIVEYVNSQMEKNILRIGNFSDSMFWLTFD